jgi:hypothetical protein
MTDVPPAPRVKCTRVTGNQHCLCLGVVACVSQTCFIKLKPARTSCRLMLATHRV